ncbi:PGF-pre-PGF domain-containing protein [Methanosarcina barkeri]|uniref:Cell surface protein n=1 Tax=Methanosarcina barkeri CM1 TaxID=796385 RepID=A0A0G3C8Y5_METBA|nr:PGF-pre-PGF domain-containing protein [Methanosarcina barkeri]AKJ38459.1 cell surface protein [Methanosarcina barkeri CM1]
MKIKCKLCSIALTSTVLVFIFLALISTLASAAQVTKIGSGSDPAIYGNKVVWTNSGVIKVYDLTARTVTTVNSSAASYPAIYGNILVWHDESSKTPRLAVYDMSTAAKTYITQNVDQSSRPAIYGNRIVWSADYNESNYNYNVYMRDISTSKQTKIANGNSPDIYDTRITYGYEDADGRTIAVYDINTKETINVHSSSQIFSPHIYGNKVIWSNFYSRDGFIEMYDLITKKTIDVTSDNTGNTLYGPDVIADAGDDTGTHIDINGDKIVYSKSGDDQFGYAGVYVYDIPSAKSTPVYIYPKETYTTPDVYENTIVWGIDSNYGRGETEDSDNNGIYLSDLSAINSLLQVAEFTANVTSGTAPLVVLFTANGIDGGSASWLWDFGDGITSKHEMKATHTFTKPGTYDVTLKVTGATGNISIDKLGYIRVTNSTTPDLGIPVANFSSSVIEGYAPLTVQFTDLSQNAVSRVWDFDSDGKADSSDPNPIYIYSTPGTYFVNLTIYNANGFSYLINTITVLESNSSDDSNSSSDGNSKSGGSKSSGSKSSGSGGGGGSPEPAKNIEVKELSQVFITNGKEVKFDFTKNATCVVSVNFDAKKTLGKTTTIVEMLKGKSSLVSELPSGEVYKSFNVWVGNGGIATSKNVENPTVCFKVEKSWIENKKIDPASITLNSYSEKKWGQLEVETSGIDDKFLYFTAKTPEFSSFAITGTAKKISDETVTESQPEAEIGAVNNNVNENETGNEGMEAEQKEIQGTSGFEIGLGIACILGLFLYKRKH